jgi:hypothetical protein
VSIRHIKSIDWQSLEIPDGWVGSWVVVDISSNPHRIVGQGWNLDEALDRADSYKNGAGHVIHRITGVDPMQALWRQEYRP